MSSLVEVKGLKELIARMQRYPAEMNKAMSETMQASLLTLWESVPSYPDAPDSSTYDRTGQLGRSLGSDIGGGALGEPSIYTIKNLGSTGYEGKFGTNLDYADVVIGDGTQAQAHAGRWWTISTIANKAADKINRLWQTLGDKMAKFLEGRGA